MSPATGVVVAVSRSDTHTMSKPNRATITLLAGLGVEGDTHAGVTVQHRSRVAIDPTQPNLRQVHLLHSELLAIVAADGFDIEPGEVGENITTRGIDLLSLPTSTLLHLGANAVIEVTGLRNPCGQLNGLCDGLRAAFLDRGPDGELIRLGGVMSIVIVGGEVRPGDLIDVQLPGEAHVPLQPV